MAGPAAADRDRDGTMVLRVALATPLAMVVALGLGLPLAYLASILVIALLPTMPVRPPLRQMAMLVFLVVAFSSGIVALMTPLLASMSVYLGGLGALLYALFRLQGHSKYAPLAALALPLLVALSTLLPASAQATRGLAVLLGLHALIAMGAVLIAWLVFPGPPTPAAARPAPVPPRTTVDAAVSAAILLALIAGALALDAQAAMRMLLIACSVLSVSDPHASVQRAAMTMGATVTGVFAAWLLTGLIALAASMAMAALLAALVPLLIGRRLADPRTGAFWLAALSAMWVLLGFDGTVTTAKLFSYTLLTLGGIAVAIGVRHTLLWHFDRTVRAAWANG